MRFGGKYNYIDAREDGVLFHHENVTVFGENGLFEDFISYSEISSVRYTDTGGLFPTIGVYVNLKGKSFPNGKNPYGYAMAGGSNRDAAKGIKAYIEEMIGQEGSGLSAKCVQNKSIDGTPLTYSDFTIPLAGVESVNILKRFNDKFVNPTNFLFTIVFSYNDPEDRYYKTKRGISFSSSMEDIIRKYGYPDEGDESYSVYTDEDPVIFHMAYQALIRTECIPDARLQQLENASYCFEYYIDDLEMKKIGLNCLEEALVNFFFDSSKKLTNITYTIYNKAVSGELVQIMTLSDRKKYFSRKK